MGFQVSIEPSQHSFQAESEETILDAALRQGLCLPYGCRDGVCGSCRGKVLNGLVEHGKAQLDVLGASVSVNGIASDSAGNVFFSDPYRRRVSALCLVLGEQPTETRLPLAAPGLAVLGRGEGGGVELRGRRLARVACVERVH